MAKVKLTKVNMKMTKKKVRIKKTLLFVFSPQLNFIFKLVELPPISAASMLTRKDIKEFKESVRRDNDAIIKVGSGETVTVRVPTHEEGRLIFWEFATDYYDIGFGLYFEWTISPSNNVTVHVSDSSEDEEGEEGN